VDLKRLRHKLRRDDAAANPIKEVAIGFIMIGVALVISLVFLPVITSQVAKAQNDSNVSGSDATLLGLLPTLLIVGLIGGGVTFLFRAFRRVNAR
jgi:uncharacterized BrkB/YihY/UPF0761 family membrane protein